ncbi:MAG TPA: hypothetical protein PLL10_06865, partial [Elusimicrobiales bacterium]|nr:hypothetical protein [Elusimicrobiales bacterium]
LGICSGVGFITLLTYYSPHPVSGRFLDNASRWSNIIYAFAFVLGLLSMFSHHYGKIRRQAEGWGYSVFVFVGFLAMVIPALLSRGKSTSGGELTALGWSFKFIYGSLMSAMFSVLAFYMASTLFRSFRIRSWQTLVLALSAFLLIAGRVPLGQALLDKALAWTGLDSLQAVEWVMSVPAVAARRAIMLGIAVGGAAAALKLIFGFERQYMGKS